MPSAWSFDRTKAAQSRMAESCHAAQGPHERGPSRALFRQHAAAFRCEAIAAPAPLAPGLPPTALDPPALLELVEQRIERCRAKRQQAFRPLGDLTTEVVAVQLARFQTREDEQLRTALPRRSVGDGVGHVFESDISQY